MALRAVPGAQKKSGESLPRSANVFQRVETDQLGVQLGVPISLAEEPCIPKLTLWPGPMVPL
jgi:hypothetical protein